MLIGSISIGCHSVNLAKPNTNAVKTHYKVDLPPKLSPKKTFLWIGLGPQLGIKVINNNSSSKVLLKSAGRPMSLRDGSGKYFKAQNFSINFREVSLSKPYNIERQVIGPFASFESASRVAKDLSKKGLKPLIAHPRDWEVWLPVKASIPINIKVSKMIKTINSSIKPFIELENTSHLLEGNIEIQAPDGMHWDQGIFQGPFQLQPNSYGSWTLIEKVNLEKYLEGVVPHEIGSRSPAAALQAQSVLARTWAIANSHRYAIDGYHLCSNTQCQVYRDPRKATKSVKEAIQKTNKKILTWKNQPIQAFYHASNGGIMASADEAWAINRLPYLKEKVDGNKILRNKFQIPIKSNKELRVFLKTSIGAFGSNHSRFRWERTLTAKQLKELFEFKEKINEDTLKLKVLKRGKSGRVLSLEILDSSSRNRKILRLDAIRRLLPQLPSTLFVIQEENQGTWKLSGGGFGHGVGLSQAGAIDLASQGWGINSILQHYYPGTKYEPLRDFSKSP